MLTQIYLLKIALFLEFLLRTTFQIILIITCGDRLFLLLLVGSSIDYNLR